METEHIQDVLRSLMTARVVKLSDSYEIHPKTWDNGQEVARRQVIRFVCFRRELFLIFINLTRLMKRRQMLIPAYFSVIFVENESNFFSSLMILP